MGGRVNSCQHWLSSSTVMGSASRLQGFDPPDPAAALWQSNIWRRHAVASSSSTSWDARGLRQRADEMLRTPLYYIRDTLHHWESFLLLPCLSFPITTCPCCCGCPPSSLPPSHFARPRDRSGGADLSGSHQLPYTPAHPSASHMLPLIQVPPICFLPSKCLRQNPTIKVPQTVTCDHCSMHAPWIFLMDIVNGRWIIEWIWSSTQGIIQTSSQSKSANADSPNATDLVIIEVFCQTRTEDHDKCKVQCTLKKNYIIFKNNIFAVCPA